MFIILRIKEKIKSRVIKKKKIPKFHQALFSAPEPSLKEIQFFWNIVWGCVILFFVCFVLVGFPYGSNLS